MVVKMTLRQIRKSLGRFFAIAAIVALGIGFFCGLRLTKSAMLHTLDRYLSDHRFYDFALYSSVGFDSQAAERIAAQDGVDACEGSKSLDALATMDGYPQAAYRFISLPQQINTLELKQGRLPQNATECLADAWTYTKEDLGKTVSVDDPQIGLAAQKYTVVGLVKSPLYLNNERGSTSVGTGTLTGFFYLPKDAFLDDYDTTLYVTLTGAHGSVYSAAYRDSVDAARTQVTELAAQEAQQRAAQFGQSAQSYVLDRDDNVGYACFESDSDIVNSVSRVFPLFFFAVAALICITTMTRMVSEQRTQSGVLKALGYSDLSIMNIYFLYATSASLLGCVVGLAAGSLFLPQILFRAYNITYGFSSRLLYTFDWALALCASVAYLLCALSATWLAIRSELVRPAAQLIRPKAPKVGKRILLERTDLWEHIGFLCKVSIRNLLRYKLRMFMMIIGIGGCTALLITGYGLRDSIANVVNYQFDEITTYDLDVVFRAPQDDGLENALYVSQESFDVSGGGKSKEAYVLSVKGDDTSGFVDLHDGNKAVSYPTDNACILSRALADTLGIKVGDTLTIDHRFSVTVSGIFDNYLYHYVYLNGATYTEGFGHAPQYRTAWVSLPEGSDVRETAASLRSDANVLSVNVSDDLRERMGTMMQSLNYIVLIVVICAAVLAFIVLYNLTNINITERTREIATIKVLGFYDAETNRYILRENLILTVLGALAGIPMGIALHAYVMAQIKLDLICFDVRISLLSFALSVLMTVLFGVAVNLLLKRKIRGVDMAQALKSVE